MVSAVKPGPKDIAQPFAPDLFSSSKAFINFLSKSYTDNDNNNVRKIFELLLKYNLNVNLSLTASSPSFPDFEYPPESFLYKLIANAYHFYFDSISFDKLNNFLDVFKMALDAGAIPDKQFLDYLNESSSNLFFFV